MDNEALINGYFENTLSEDQLGKLDRLLKTDTEFAAEFELQNELQKALKKEERQEIKSLFSNLKNETANDLKGTIPKETETKVISIRPWLVAASVVFLLGLGSWMLFFNGPDLNTDQLYAANFAPYENVVHPIQRGEQLENLKTRAFIAYEDADYGLALELFKELQVQQTDPYIAFYEAIILMQLNKHQEAVPLLEGYIGNDGQLKDRAIWYLALAYLKENDVGKSTTQLEKLIELGSFKKEAAQELLEELDVEL